MSEAFHTIGCFNIHELIMSSDGRTITQSQCPVESWKGLIDESSVAINISELIQWIQGYVIEFISNDINIQCESTFDHVSLLQRTPKECDQIRDVPAVYCIRCVLKIRDSIAPS